MNPRPCPRCHRCDRDLPACATRSAPRGAAPCRRRRQRAATASAAAAPQLRIVATIGDSASTHRGRSRSTAARSTSPTGRTAAVYRRRRGHGQRRARGPAADEAGQRPSSASPPMPPATSTSAVPETGIIYRIDAAPTRRDRLRCRARTSKRLRHRRQGCQRPRLRRGRAPLDLGRRRRTSSITWARRAARRRSSRSGYTHGHRPTPRCPCAST